MDEPLPRKPKRSDHNDKDVYCVFWWGDRGGYSLDKEKCRICNPKGF